jgi:hypothetical protein
MLLSWVITDGVWIGNWIYWTPDTQLMTILYRSLCIHTDAMVSTSLLVTASIGRQPPYFVFPNRPCTSAIPTLEWLTHQPNCIYYCYYCCCSCSHKVKIKIYYDWRSVRHPSGIHDHPWSIIVRQLQVYWCGAPSLMRGWVCSLQFLLGLTSQSFSGLSPAGLITILYGIKLETPPQSGEPGSCIYFPRKRVAQLHPVMLSQSQLLLVI